MPTFLSTFLKLKRLHKHCFQLLLNPTILKLFILLHIARLYSSSWPINLVRKICSHSLYKCGRTSLNLTEFESNYSKKDLKIVAEMNISDFVVTYDEGKSYCLLKNLDWNFTMIILMKFIPLIYLARIFLWTFLLELVIVF